MSYIIGFIMGFLIYLFAPGADGSWWIFFAWALPISIIEAVIISIIKIGLTDRRIFHDK